MYIMLFVATKVVLHSLPYSKFSQRAHSLRCMKTLKGIDAKNKCL